MKLKSSISIAIIFTLVHCIIGNVIGIYSSGQSFWAYLFLPYSFISGMSEFAGWDELSIVFEILALFVSFLIFYTIVLSISYLFRRKHKS